MIINTVVYIIQWDPEDCRFSCYDDTVWDSKEAAIFKIYEWCEKHKPYLQPAMNEDDFKGSFEAWVAWCIKEFCYFATQTVYGYSNLPDNEE